MALVSAKTIILFRSCFLWSLGYMLVMSPKKVSEHPLVLLIGQAMEIPPAHIEDSNQLLGLLAIVLITAGLSDIPLLAVEGSHYITVNAVIVPLRLLIFFAATAWAYVSPENSLLHNGLVFAYGFVEVIINFLIYVVVREEKNEIIGAEIKLRHQD